MIFTPTDEYHVGIAVICKRGHDYEGLSYSSEDDDPFVMIDIKELRSIKIDVEQGTAWIQAGATMGELYYSIGNKSRTLGFPAGICSTIGVGGHFSGGGIGNMMRKYGLASDQIIDVRFVNAEGKILNRKSMGEDLFWAIRGGGGASYGIILAYQVKLVPVPPKVTAFTVSRTLEQNATQLVNKWQQIAHNMDENLFIRTIIQGIDDDNGNRTVRVMFNSLFLGSKNELLPIVGKSFPELGLEADDCQEMSWVESTASFAGFKTQVLDSLLDRAPPPHKAFKSKSDFLQEPISESGWEKIWKWLMEGHDHHLVMIVDPFGGMLDKIPDDYSPFPHRNGSLYNIQYYLQWVEGGIAEANRHISWLRNFYKNMKPFVPKNPRATYVNYKDLDLGRNKKDKTSFLRPSIWGRKYFKSNFRRLATVKAKVDPENFFRNEQSIPPLFLKIGREYVY